MRKSIMLQIVVSLAAVLLVIYLSDFTKTADILTRANPLYIFLSALLYIALNLFMAYRITLVLKEVHEKLSFTEALEASLSGMLASDFTPGRTGYFATAFLMTANSKIKLDKTMLSILGPQLFEFAFKCIIGALAMWYIMELLVSETGGEARFLGMLLGVAVFISMILFIALLLFSKSFVGKIAFIKVFPYGAYAHTLLVDMQKNSKAVRKLIPQITVIYFATWLMKSLEWLLIAKSIGMQVNSPVPEIVFFAFLHPLITILQFIPTPTLAGMGLSEGGAAVVLSLFGVPPYQSVAFALLGRSMNMLVDLLGIKGAVKVINKL